MARDAGLAVAAYHRSATEDEMAATIRDAVTVLGGRCWHVRRGPKWPK
jgi:hypothetical protein